MLRYVFVNKKTKKQKDIIVLGITPDDKTDNEAYTKIRKQKNPDNWILVDTQLVFKR